MGRAGGRVAVTLVEMCFPPAPYLLRDTAALWVVFSAPFWGHLEKDKRKRHQKAVSGAACLCPGFVPTDGHHIQPRAE